MHLKTNIHLLLACTFVTLGVRAATTNNPKCPYEDTVDLTNSKRFYNGSYLYENILIPPDRIATYDYEEIFQGIRLPRKSHLRGCVCHERSCVRFCCHPTRELIANYSRTCSSEMLVQELEYDSYINVTLNNGSVVKRHVLEEFTVLQGVPCVGAYALVPQDDEEDSWEIFENGTLLRHYDMVQLSRRDYCLMPMELESGEWVLNPMNCPILKAASLSLQINNIAMAISVPFIILTIMVYAYIPELLNLHGKCLISYLSPLAMGYSILSTISLSEVVFPNLVCSCLGYVAYYCFMSAFFWLSVISFDLWQNFRLTGSMRFGQRKRFCLYSIYAWGIPACLTLAVIALQNSNMDDLYKPGIGDDYCWLKTNDWSAMIYFFGINLVIVLIDIIFFSMTYYKITVMQRDINKIIRNDTNEGRHQLRTHKNNFGLFLRLFLIMGVSWLLDIVSYIETLLYPDDINPLYYVSDFMNAILGLLIFVCFVLKPKVLSLIKKRLFGKQDETDNTTHSDCEEEEISLNGIGSDVSKERKELN
ncbi:G-protein coupled receptor Mth2-like [Musca vetustissima]|uniref:G-protein coupled receptor Mth2-like n=2 Tax=Musca vetustissima TaxID=27455 RepID=UPI002AB685B8|nr:G-protein coupled receptor Mth2-like [Musca vetustissima]